MSTVTFGMYEVFWFYKNWHYVQEHTHKKTLPLASAIFAFVTYYSLLKEIERAGATQNKPFGQSAAILAIAFFVTSLLARVLSLLGILTPLALVPAQLYINSLNANSPTPCNDKFTVANWVWIVLGGTWYLLALISIFLPRTP